MRHWLISTGRCVVVLAILLAAIGCNIADIADQPTTQESILLSPIALKERFFASVNAKGVVLPRSIVFARIDIPEYPDYFFPDGTGKPSITNQYGQNNYQVRWQISRANEDTNILINSVADGKFIAVNARGETLGANKLPTGAFAYFIANYNLTGGQYTITAELTDGNKYAQTGEQIIATWQRDFELAEQFKFPESFRFSVRGLAFDKTSHLTKSAKVPAAPVTGEYTIKNTASKTFDEATAEVGLKSAATATRSHVIYYDFKSLIDGYKIDFFYAGNNTA